MTNHDEPNAQACAACGRARLLDAPVEVVRSMVYLAEMFGHTLPWANLTEACGGLATPDQLRWAVEDLVQERAIEVTPKGLRFLLTEPTA